MDLNWPVFSILLNAKCLTEKQQHHVAEQLSLCNKQQSLSHFQTLLRYGANPELRDEDGKTPLDKARERGDEGHREVIQILQSPGGYLTCIP
jgi:ankyrin repeat protein